MPRNDPADMSVDERLDEIASLLAAGFLRLKRRTGCLPLTQRVPQSRTNRAAIAEHGSARCVKGLPPATSDSAESSKIPPESACHLSETAAPCAPR
jgi:hypothetical protein